nr:MAG TPA: hypothetical protein [Caudoviricetes sp.]
MADACINSIGDKRVKDNRCEGKDFHLVDNCMYVRKKGFPVTIVG